MASGKDREVYYKDDINSIRSFMGLNCPEYPTAIPDRLKTLLISHHKPELPDDMIILLHYIEALQLINLTGYHTSIPKMMTNLYELSQSMRTLDLTDPETQAALRK